MEKKISLSLIKLHIFQCLTIWLYFILICFLFMFQIVLYFSHNILVLSFNIDVVFTLSILHYLIKIPIKQVWLNLHIILGQYLQGNYLGFFCNRYRNLQSFYIRQYCFPYFLSISFYWCWNLCTYSIRKNIPLEQNAHTAWGKDPHRSWIMCKDIYIYIYSNRTSRQSFRRLRYP